MSWRDSTPQPVQNDLDLLLGHGLDQADQMLVGYGEFYPFALHTGPDGISAAMADLEVGENPTGAELLRALVAGLRKVRHTIRAAATVVPVVLEDGSDAVCVQLEHKEEAPSLVVLRPYTLTGIGRPLRHGQTQAQPADRRIWT